jgi:two-component system response regulator RegX3
VVIARDGATGLEKFRDGGIDLVLLDLMLPVMDGLEVCRNIRRDSSVPILILTAKDSDLDKVLGLELGADDYVTKPFNTRELLARIKAVLRRVQVPVTTDAAQLQWGKIKMDGGSREVTVGEETLSLTPLEYGILEVFLRHPRKALPREYLITQVWGGNFYGPTKTLDVHIRHLREKVEDDPSHPRYIVTVRGIGYRLEKPAEE